MIIGSQERLTVMTGADMPDKDKVLVVDDEPLNVKLIASVLSASGYEVYQARNGEEAFKAAAQNNPDVILLDIMMPGMDGYEVTEKLKRDPSTNGIPIVLVTALEGVDDKVRGLGAGADDFLSKPVNHTELLARVRSLIKLKKLQDGLKKLAAAQETQVPSQPESPRRGDKGLILIAEDDVKLTRIYTGILASDGYRATVFGNGEKVLESLKNVKPDLIMLDIMLPDMDGLEVLARIKADPATMDIPVLIISVFGDLENKVKGIDTGADDYLIKPVNHHELLARVRAVLRKSEASRQLRARLESAVSRSLTDELTGLYNRHYLSTVFERGIHFFKRHRNEFSIMMLDLDHFKNINDTFGHPVGDGVLKELACLIKMNIRASDVAARYGGEEFVVFLPSTNLSEAAATAEKLRSVIQQHRFSGVQERAITLSIGVTAFKAGDSDMDSIIKRADDALYAAKNHGRNAVRTAV